MKDERAHVVLLTTDFKPSPGGISEYLENLYTQLARHVPVSVVTTVPGAPAPGSPHLLRHAVPAIERRLGERWGDGVASVRRLNTARHFLALSRMARQTVEGITRADDGQAPQVFIGIWDDTAHFWCRALRRAGLRYWLHVYGKDIVEPRYPRMAHWRAGDVQAAEQIIAVSATTGSLLSSRFRTAQAPEVVRPGVAAPRDRAAIAQRAHHLRQEMDLGTDPIVLSLGRLVERKGLDLVLRAVHGLPPRVGCVSYLVAGDGPERSKLEALARDLGTGHRVRFLGHVDETTKWALIDLCDLLVLANHDAAGTDFEGFGIVFLEAALFAKPSIAGNSGGVHEAIVDGHTGVLVPPSDVASLTTAIASLLTNGELRKRMGDQARMRAAAEFDWDRRAREFASRRGWLRPES